MTKVIHQKLINHPTCRVIISKDTHNNNHKSYKSIKHTINSSNNPTCSIINIPALFLPAMLLALLCTTLSSFIGLPTSAYAENVTFQVYAEPRLTVSVPSSPVQLNVAPASTGTFGNQDITVSVATNNGEGYSLTMLASNSDLRRNTALGNGTVPVVPSIASGTSYTDAQFSAASTDETYGSNGTNSEVYTNTINHWAYKRTTSTLGTTNYLPVPTVATQIESCASGGSCNPNGQSTTVNLGIKLDNNTPSGTYSTTLVFVATANIVPSSCPAGAICYNDNNMNSPTTMGNQTIATIDTSGETPTYTLADNTFLRASNYQVPSSSATGYGFAGWNTKSDGTGTPYGPNQSIADADITTMATEQGIDKMSEGITLYAMWVQSAGNLQDWQGCPNLAIGSVTALTDERDGNTYAVAKLADGNCWMIENMRLNNSAAIASDKTNILNPFQDGQNNPAFSALSASSNSWCQTQDAACYNQSMLNTNNTTSTVTNMTNNNQNVYSYGNYYNWYSATAGYGTYDTVITVDGTEYNPSVNNTTMPGDICPAGWHLPIGASTTTSGSFSQLDRAMGGTGVYQNSAAASQRWRTYPNNFLYSGNWTSSWSGNRGSRGYYWPSTASSAVGANNLYLTSSGVYPGTGSDVKHYGFSARCVANS